MTGTVCEKIENVILDRWPWLWSCGDSYSLVSQSKFGSSGSKTSNAAGFEALHCFGLQATRLQEFSSPKTRPNPALCFDPSSASQLAIHSNHNQRQYGE